MSTDEYGDPVAMGCARSNAGPQQWLFERWVSGVARPANFYRHAKVKRGRRGRSGQIYTNDKPWLRQRHQQRHLIDA